MVSILAPANPCSSTYYNWPGACINYFPQAGRVNFGTAVNFCALNSGSNVFTFTISGSYLVDTSNGKKSKQVNFIHTLKKMN
jgi:hypothetical protein